MRNGLMYVSTFGYPVDLHYYSGGVQNYKVGDTYQYGGIVLEQIHIDNAGIKSEVLRQGECPECKAKNADLVLAVAKISMRQYHPKVCCKDCADKFVDENHTPDSPIKNAWTIPGYKIKY